MQQTQNRVFCSRDTLLGNHATLPPSIQIAGHLGQHYFICTISRLRKNATKRRKSFLQGPFVAQDKLKPVESTQCTSAPFEAQDELKHRPPKEKDFSRSLLERHMSRQLRQSHHDTRDMRLRVHKQRGETYKCHRGDHHFHSHKGLPSEHSQSVIRMKHRIVSRYLQSS
jgi:hypothetical protein